MTQNTVELVQDADAKGEEVCIAVGSSSGNEHASSDDIDIEWEDTGMLRIRLPQHKRKLVMQCVVNGSWDVGDKWR